MGWTAILGAALTLAIEIFKLISETRAEQKEQKVELKKEKTEILQSIARGIIDRDASRINAGFDKLHRLRQQ